MNVWRRIKNIWRLGEYRIGGNGEVGKVIMPQNILVKDGEKVQKSEKKLATIVMPDHDTTD